MLLDIFDAPTTPLPLNEVFLYTFGHERVLLSQTRGQRNAQLGRLGVHHSDPKHYEGSLALVVQKGRAFLRAHPKCQVLVDRGRFLIVANPPPPAQEHHFSVLGLPKDGIIFRTVVPERPSPLPWLVDMIDAIPVETLHSRIAALSALESRYSCAGQGGQYETAGRMVERWLKHTSLTITRQTFDIEHCRSFNIVAEIEGQGTERGLVVLGAHLDSTSDAGQAPGADDNASGVAALTWIAEELSKMAFEHDIRFVLFGGEEQWMLGSGHFVDQLATDDRARFLGMLNLDMIASPRTPKRTVLFEGPGAGERLLPFLRETAASYTHLQIQNSSLDQALSDHRSFVEEDLPAVLAIEGTHQANSDIHTSADTIEKLDMGLMRQITALALAWTVLISVPVGRPIGQ